MSIFKIISWQKQAQKFFKDLKLWTLLFMRFWSYESAHQSTSIAPVRVSEAQLLHIYTCVTMHACELTQI